VWSLKRKADSKMLMVEAACNAASKAGAKHQTLLFVGPTAAPVTKNLHFAIESIQQIAGAYIAFS
jgi:hypothetical protein